MNDKDILIGQILETDNIIRSKYFQFLENAINNQDSSRYILIDFPATLLQKNRFGDAKMDYKSLYNLLNPTLFRINRLLIDKNDFELFKHEIDHFIKVNVLEYPIKIRKEIKAELFNFGNGLYFNEFQIKSDETIESHFHHLMFLVKYKFFKNIQCYYEFDREIKSLESYLTNRINELKNEKNLKHIRASEVKSENNDESTEDIEKSEKEISLIINGSEEIMEWGIKPNLYELCVNSLVYKTFFMIGAYIIFSNRYRDINGVKYLKELWYHTQPSNQNVTWHVVSDLVSFDIFWLINLYLFGLSDDESWTDWPNEFDDYNEARPYLIQYFLLCLTKANKIDIFPNSDKVMELNSEKNLDELRECYDLSNKFYSKRSELNYNLNILINESIVWDDILSRIIIENGERKQLNAKEILLKTKDQLNDTMEELEGIIAFIEKILPLNKDKISDAKDRIISSYSRHSKIPDIFSSRKYDKDKDSKREIIEIIQKNDDNKPIKRNCFIENPYCTYYWFNIGKAIADKEFEYFNNEISKNIHIPRYSATSNLDNIYEKIVNSTKIIKENYNPDLIIIPVKIFTLMRKFNYIHDSSLFHKVMDNNLLINDNLKLKVFNLPYFKDIMILDSSSISWIYELNPETNEKIFVEINEIENDLPEVDVIAKVLFNMKIVNPKGISLITIS